MPIQWNQYKEYKERILRPSGAVFSTGTRLKGHQTVQQCTMQHLKFRNGQLYAKTVDCKLHSSVQCPIAAGMVG